MRLMPTWRLSASLALLVAVGLTWGCAQEVGDIDRTQPELLNKDLFETDDEWYFSQTIIDTEMEGGNIGDGSFQPNQSPMFAFPALEAPLKRIRFTVTENVLYAHSSVELAEGLNQGFDEEDARRLGVVAAFPIRDHVDVQRQYSSTTGEPTNVIVEDRSDRPWYERDYIRVDWSTNMVDGFRLFQGDLGRFSAVSYDVPQEDKMVDPNRTRVTDELIDTVTEYSFNPDIYSCFDAFGLDAVWSCEGGRVSVRNSLKRVPQEETYEPLNYTDTYEVTTDGEEGSPSLQTARIFDPELGYLVEVECNDTVKNWMLQRDGIHYTDRCGPAKFDMHQRFGYFRTERVAWDRYVGTSDDQRNYYVNRWNIWQTMLDEDGQSLEPSERTPQPITFYLNLEYPEFMFDAAQDTAAEWNDIFRTTTKIAMGVTASELDTMLEDEYGHTEMFRIVENSCHPGPLVEWYNDYGHDFSNDQGSVEQIFSDYVGVTDGGETMERALWDLPNDSRANLCGELEYATELRDDMDARFDWERFGDIRYSFFNWVEENVPWAGYGPSLADPLTGEIIRGNANFAGAYIRQQATYAADLIQYFNGELSEDDLMAGVQIREDLFRNEMDTSRFGLEPDEDLPEDPENDYLEGDMLTDLNIWDRPAMEDMDTKVQSYGLDRIQREADRVAETMSKNQLQDTRFIEVLEKPRVRNIMLSDVEARMSAEATAIERHGDNFSDEQFHQAYLDVHTPQIAAERKARRKRMLGERSIHGHDVITSSLEQLVTYQGVADYFKGKSRDDIRHYFMNGMFVGTQLHEIGHTVGLRHNFSSHADALNYYDEFWKIEQAIVEGEITREEAYSLHGEDLAAIIGEENVEDFDYLSQAETKLASIMDYTADMTGRFTGLGKYDRAAIKFAYGEVVEQWSDDVYLPNTLDNDLFLANYRELPIIMAQDHAGEENAYAIGVERIINGREYVPIEDAMADRRRGIVENTAQWENYAFDNGNEPFIDRAVEYNFCSDEFNGQILDCAVWSYGANQSEMVNHAYDSYRALQPFWRHRRHNVARNYDNLSAYQNRLIRTMQVSQEPFRYYSIYRWLNLGGFTADLERAAIDGFNFFNELLTMVQPGRYCPHDPNRTTVSSHWYFDLDDAYVPADWHSDGGNCAGAVTVELGDGYLYNFTFSDEYEYRIDSVGTYIDKMMATVMMFNMNANFAQSAFFTDRRATNLSYWTLFQDELLDVLGGLALGDFKRHGAIYKDGRVEYVPPVDPDTWGIGKAPGDEVEGTRIFNPQSLNHELNALLGGLIFGATWEDRAVDFTHYIKVATTNDEWQDFGPDEEIAEFNHPISNQIYRAPEMNGQGIGAEMIERANYLSDRYVSAAEELEQAEPGTAQYNQWDAITTQRLEQLQDVVAKMDLVRDAIEMTYSLR